MSRFALQCIALIAMTIDHSAIIAKNVGYISTDTYLMLRTIGRIAYPLFAFMVAEGLHKTRNLKNYVKRLVVFSIITQLPFMLFEVESISGMFRIESFRFNMIVSYALVALLIWRCKAWAKEKQKQDIFWIALIVVIIVISSPKLEYGILGVAFVLSLFVAYPERWLQVFIIVIWSILEYYNKGISYIIGAMASGAILIFYNGEVGKTKFPRYFLYWYYPAHLTVLGVIQAIL